MAISFISILLALSLPLILSAANCDPDSCPKVRCCTQKDTCANSILECGTCDPSNCASGCCDGVVCAISSDACSIKRPTVTIIVSIVCIVSILCVAFISYKLVKRSIDRRERQRRETNNIDLDRQAQNESACKPSQIPIHVMEIKAPEYELSSAIPIVNGDIIDVEKATEVVEINHVDFMKRLKGQREICIRNGIALQNSKLTKGQPLAPSDNVKRPQAQIHPEPQTPNDSQPSN